MGKYHGNKFFIYATPHFEALPKIVAQLAMQMQIGNNNYTRPVPSGTSYMLIIEQH
jgi:hypothetical protein